MDWLKRKFVEHFNMEMVASDLIDIIDDNEETERELTDYIHNEFAKAFSREEIIEKFKDELETLNDFLQELGYEKLSDKEIEELEDNDNNNNIKEFNLKIMTIEDYVKLFEQKHNYDLGKPETLSDLSDKVNSYDENLWDFPMDELTDIARGFISDKNNIVIVYYKDTGESRVFEI